MILMQGKVKKKKSVLVKAEQTAGAPAQVFYRTVLQQSFDLRAYLHVLLHMLIHVCAYLCVTLQGCMCTSRPVSI